jgi:hypothetical protein
MARSLTRLLFTTMVAPVVDYAFMSICMHIHTSHLSRRCSSMSSSSSGFCLTRTFCLKLHLATDPTLGRVVLTNVERSEQEVLLYIWKFHQQIDSV